MLGNQTVKHLKENGVKEIILPSHSDYDLTKEEAVINLFETNPKIDLVIHIAGDVGGIGYSKKSPGQQFYNNILMNTFVQHYSYFYGVKKFIGIGSVCEYPAIVYGMISVYIIYPIS